MNEIVVDGVVLYHPDNEDRQEIYLYSNIYMGPDSGGKYVPSVGDYVLKPGSGFYKVISVDETTAIPTLKHDPFTDNVGDISLVSDVRRWQPSVLERVYYDGTVTPHKLTFDDRFYFYHDEVREYKVFKGTNTSSSGEVISTKLNSNGDVIGENYMTETVSTSNPVRKRPKVTYINTELLEDSPVTVVTYNDEGGVIGEHSFKVRNSNAIRGVEENQVHLLDIHLLSVLIDADHPDDHDLIKVPANTSVHSNSFSAKLVYSDGSETVVPVDGNKVKLLGLDNFNTSNAGATNGNVTLTYSADANEPIMNVSNPLARSISRQYRMIVVPGSNALSFKLWISPSFNTTTSKFEFKYYLTNLDYDTLIEVDPTYVTAEVNGETLDVGAGAGTKTIDLTLSITDVIPTGFEGYILSQTVTITFGDIGGTSDPWVIDYVNNGDDMFGLDEKLQFSTTYSGGYPLSLKSSYITSTDWIDALYKTIRPLFNNNLTTTPPTPTHIQLNYGGVMTPPIQISGGWDQLHNNQFDNPWVSGETVDIIWLKDDPGTGGMLKLGVSPLAIFGTL